MGNLKFNAGQLLQYAEDFRLGIPWHRDGSAHQGDVDGNSQVGGTGVPCVTLEGTGKMLFGHEGVTGRDNIIINQITHVDFEEGHVFFMSALVDRLLFHSTEVGENGRVALILRCLNQPRLFKKGGNNNAQIVLD